MADFGVKMILVAFLLQCFDIFCCFDLVENGQILGVKTGKNNKKLRNPKISKVFGGDKRDRTADLLNAIQALSQLSYTPIFGLL